MHSFDIYGYRIPICQNYQGIVVKHDESEEERGLPLSETPEENSTARVIKRKEESRGGDEK